MAKRSDNEALIRIRLDDLGVVYQRLEQIGKHSSSQSHVYRLVDAELGSLAALGITGAAATEILAGSEDPADELLVTIALKVASSEADKAWLEREATVLRALAADGSIGCVPMVLDSSGNVTGRDMLPLQYIEGVDLYRLAFSREEQDRCNANRENLTAVVIALWESISKVHRRQVAHRDFRLPNIMLPPAGQEQAWRHPIILDFGRAFHPLIPLLDDKRAPQPSSVVQTSGWRVPRREYDPERRSLETEQAVDIYMWAANAYMLLTGERLFVRESDEDQWVTSDDPQRIEELRAKIDLTPVPEQLREALQVALAHNPEDRDSATISRLLKGEVIVGEGPTGPAKRLRPTMTFASALLGVGLLLFAVYRYMLGGGIDAPLDSDWFCELSTTDLPSTELSNTPFASFPGSSDPECEALVVSTSLDLPDDAEWDELPFSSCGAAIEPAAKGFHVAIVPAGADPVGISPGPLVEGEGLFPTDAGLKTVSVGGVPVSKIRVEIDENWTLPGDGNRWIASCDLALVSGGQLDVHWLPGSLPNGAGNGVSVDSTSLFEAEDVPVSGNVEGPGDGVVALDWAVVADRSLLATGRRSGGVEVWDPERESLVHHLPTSAVRDVAWSPDGSWLAVAADQGLLIWSAQGSDEPRSLPDSARRISWRSDSGELVVAKHEEVYTVDPRTLARRTTYGLPAGTSQIWTLTVSPDGRYIVAGSDNGEITVWDTTDTDTAFQLQANADRIEHLGWSPEGELMAGGLDMTIRLWSIESGSETRELLDEANTSAIAWSSTSDTLVTAGTFDQLRVWDTVSGTVARKLAGHTEAAHVLSWDPSGQLLASGGWDGAVLVWDFDQSSEPVPQSLGPWPSSPSPAD